MKDKWENMKKKKINNIWREYFKAFLSEETSETTIDNGTSTPREEERMEESYRTLITMKNKEGSGTDCMNTELMKMGEETMSIRLYKLMIIVWREERTPTEFNIIINWKQ